MWGTSKVVENAQLTDIPAALVRYPCRYPKQSCILEINRQGLSWALRGVVSLHSVTKVDLHYLCLLP